MLRVMGSPAPSLLILIASHRTLASEPIASRLRPVWRPPRVDRPLLQGWLNLLCHI